MKEQTQRKKFGHYLSNDKGYYIYYLCITNEFYELLLTNMKLCYITVHILIMVNASHQSELDVSKKEETKLLTT